MLKSLLLLCCAAIVSAGDLKNASVPAISANNGVIVTPQSPEIATTSNNDDAHVTPFASHGSYTEAKSDNATTTPKAMTPPVPPPTTKPTAKTTTKPTTTTSTTSTTTTTTTTTTAAPTTPAPTTPLPPPSTGKWTVEEDNKLCIIVQMAAQFNVSYVTVKNVTKHKAMDIPINGTVTGKCGDTEQNLTLSWTTQGDTVQDYFALHFMKNEMDKHYSLHHLEIFLASEEFPDKSNKSVTLVHMAPLFSTELSNSYRCLKEQTLNLTLPGRNETVGHLKVSDMQFQAFRGDNTTVFGLAKDCSFNTPDIVPITVGCALAGLVVIVLIVYLVGRRRSQARGYLSM